MTKKITELINAYVEKFKKEMQPETSWRKPVVGFADAKDKKFKDLKEIIGPNHALPQEIVPGARSVIVYFLPFSEEIVKSNIFEEESSRAWDIANIDTNNLIVGINKMLHEWLKEQGWHASMLPPTYNYDEKKLISDWSHKSAAFIAGIGKFGVHHVLITDQGCCGRLGSIITDMELEKTPFVEEEYCLYYRNGSRKACMRRCPNQAFREETDKITFDRHKCNEQIYDKIVPIYPSGIGDACGKCMCGVPCSCQNPSKRMN